MSKVKDIMTKKVITIEADKTVSEATVLMTENNVSNLIVIQDGTPTGIVTERDFVRKVLAKNKPPTAKISEIMSTPLRVIDPDAPIKEATRKMIRKGIRRLPVISDNKLVGIITTTDIAKQLSKKTLTDEILQAIGRNYYPVPDAFEK
ncbi:MAG: CBS domain-containing protein [Candidatus Bathyarchaeota archaeon]|nr:CBS domain-containing protein [Candidatus Bathyarchaeota archaeon]